MYLAVFLIVSVSLAVTLLSLFLPPDLMPIVAYTGTMRASLCMILLQEAPAIVSRFLKSMHDIRFIHCNLISCPSLDQLWAVALKCVAECECERGCNSCIYLSGCDNYNADLNKRDAITLLRHFLGHRQP